MIHISVPKKGAHQTNHRWLTFEVPEAPVMIAGSKNGLVLLESARLLVQAFHTVGLSCSTSSATGVDEVFRRAFSFEFQEDLSDFVACESPSQLAESERLGLPCEVVSEHAWSLETALYNRTQYLAWNCSLLVLFPDNPNTNKWDRDPLLAFRTARRLGKPVFVRSQYPLILEEGDQCITQKADLFGLFRGTWVVSEGIIP